MTGRSHFFIFFTRSERIRLASGLGAAESVKVVQPYSYVDPKQALKVGSSYLCKNCEKQQNVSENKRFTLLYQRVLQIQLERL